MGAAAKSGDLFSAIRLPRKPFCTNDYADGTRPRILPAERALEFRHIQPNHPVIKFRLVYDLDRPDGCELWSPLFVHEDAGLPPPNWVAINPENGNGHVGYELEFPVRMDDEFRKAARYLAAIEYAFGKELHADSSYSGHLCKNPKHSHWETVWLTPIPYNLDYMAEFVDLAGVKFNAKNHPPNDECFSLGRNCVLFDDLRNWAYKSVRQYWAPGGLEKFKAATLLKSEMLNNQLFPNRELPFSEVKSIAKSIATWVWKKMSPVEFRSFVAATHTSEIQRARGKKGSIKSSAIRSAKAKSRRKEAKLLSITQGLGVTEIALKMNVSKGSVSAWLKSDG